MYKRIFLLETIIVGMSSAVETVGQALVLTILVLNMKTVVTMCHAFDIRET